MFGDQVLILLPEWFSKILTQSWEKYQVKLDEDLFEDQQCILKDLILEHPDVFTDMPGKTDVIQHRVKLKDNTPICCKPLSYSLPYAKRDELWNEVDSMLEMGEMRPSTSPYASPNACLRKKMVQTRYVLTLGS